MNGSFISTLLLPNFNILLGTLPRSIFRPTLGMFPHVVVQCVRILLNSFIRQAVSDSAHETNAVNQAKTSSEMTTSQFQSLSG